MAKAKHGKWDLLFCGPRQKEKNEQKCMVQSDTWIKKTMDKNHLDQTLIGLSKIWTKNHGTKIIWTKMAWEQIVCEL